MFGAIIGLRNPVGIEGVGGKDHRTGSDIRITNAGNRLGPRQIEHVVVALLVHRQRKIAFIIGLGQPQALDRGAIRAVLDKDALCGFGAE